jgi:diguanylate cyclase (GGDEF)-like protein
MQAETDGLTALYNRRTLDRLAQSSSIGDPFDDAVCLILMDIDHFKSVNDTYGHNTGDRVLIQTAEVLQSLLRSGDVVARFGGEEFAILVPGSDLSGAISIAKKIRLAIQRETFMNPEGIPLSVTASFGVARGRRGEDTWRQLIELADTSLYRAKSDGRNRVRFARDAVAAPSLAFSPLDPDDSIASAANGGSIATTSLHQY